MILHTFVTLLANLDKVRDPNKNKFPCVDFSRV